MKSRSDTVFLIVVCLVAFILRFAFVYAAREAQLTYDELQYDDIAKHLVDGKGYSWYTDVPFGYETIENANPGGIQTTFRPPLYPWFIAGIYTLFGKGNFLAVRIAQAVLGALIPLIAYFIALRCTTRNAARLAAIVTALYPANIAYCLAFLIENLFPPLAGVAFLCLLKLNERPRWLWHTLAGFFLGLSILARPSLTYFIPLLFFWFYFPKRDLKATVKSYAPIVAIIIVMVTPWVVRNYVVAEQFVYLDTRTGYNLYMGFNEHADGAFNFKSQEVFFNRLDLILNDTNRHNYGMEQAKKFIRENPGRAVALIPSKFSHFWDLDKREFIAAYSYNYIGHVPPPALFALFVLLLSPFAFITIFGTIGTAFSDFSRPICLMLLFIFYYMGIASLVLGDSRLHMALVPYITVLACNGIVHLPRILRQLRHRNKPAWGGAMLRAIAAVLIIAVFATVWTQGLNRDMDKFRRIFAPNGNQTRLPY